MDAKCIYKVAKSNKPGFEKLYNEVKTSDEDRKKLFKNKRFCDYKSTYIDFSFIKEQLQKFCKEQDDKEDLENLQDKIKKQGEKIAELEKAENGASPKVIGFISTCVMLLFSLGIAFYF